MANTIDSFLVALGFEVDPAGAKEFQKHLDVVTDSVKAVTAAATLAAGAVGLFVSSIANSIDELGDFADIEQQSIEAVSELGYVAQLTGSSLDDVKDSITGVNKVLGEAALGIGRGAKTFEKLGLDARNADGSVKNFDQLLDEVSDKIQGLSRQEAIAMTEKLGINKNLITMLMAGRDAMQELREEARALGVVTEAQAETAGRFMDSFDRTLFMIKAISRSIAVELMPALTQMMDGFRKWYLANREVISTSINKFLEVVIVLLGAFFDWAIRIVTALVQVVRWLGSTNAGLAVTAALLALIAKEAAYRTFALLASGLKLALSLLTPFNLAFLATSIIIGGVVIAVALLIDELVNFREGNDTILGDLIKDYPQLLDIINGVTEAAMDFMTWLQTLWTMLEPAILNLGDALVNLFTSLWPIIRLLGTVIGEVVSFALPLIIGLAAGIVDLITFAIGVAVIVVTGLLNAFAFVVNGISGYIDRLVSFFTNAAGSIRNVFTALFDWLFGKFDMVADKVSSAVGWVSNLFGGGSGNAATPTSGNTMSGATGGLGAAAQPSTRNTSVTYQNTTSIPGGITVVSPDPEKAGQNVRDELAKRDTQAVRNGQSAVAL